MSKFEEELKSLLIENWILKLENTKGPL